MHDTKISENSEMSEIKIVCVMIKRFMIEIIEYVTVTHKVRGFKPSFANINFKSHADNLDQKLL